MVIDGKKEHELISERDILYKVLFEMKQDVTEMKRVIVDLLNNNNLSSNEKNELITKLKSSNTFDNESNFDNSNNHPIPFEEKIRNQSDSSYNISYQESVEIEESLSLEEREKELIKKALQKHNGKGKMLQKSWGFLKERFIEKLKNLKY